MHNVALKCTVTDTTVCEQHLIFDSTQRIPTVEEVSMHSTVMLSQLDTDKRIPMQAHVHSTVHAVLHQRGFAQKIWHVNFAIK